ncbi:hypothetical protein QM042_12445 [Escherichia coli]
MWLFASFPARKDSLLPFCVAQLAGHRFMFRHVGSIACLRLWWCKGSGIFSIQQFVYRF